MIAVSLFCPTVWVKIPIFLVYNKALLVFISYSEIAVFNSGKLFKMWVHGVKSSTSKCGIGWYFLRLQSKCRQKDCSSGTDINFKFAAQNLRESRGSFPFLKASRRRFRDSPKIIYSVQYQFRHERFPFFKRRCKNFPPLVRAKMAVIFVQYKNLSSASFHLPWKYRWEWVRGEGELSFIYFLYYFYIKKDFKKTHHFEFRVFVCLYAF